MGGSVMVCIQQYHSSLFKELNTENKTNHQMALVTSSCFLHIASVCYCLPPHKYWDKFAYLKF